jgi:hypothetical protein
VTRIAKTYRSGRDLSFDLTDVELDKAAGGKPSFTDFRFLKVTDAASPALPSAPDASFWGILTSILG